MWKKPIRYECFYVDLIHMWWCTFLMWKLSYICEQSHSLVWWPVHMWRFIFTCDHFCSHVIEANCMWGCEKIWNSHEKYLISGDFSVPCLVFSINPYVKKSRWHVEMCENVGITCEDANFTCFYVPRFVFTCGNSNPHVSKSHILCHSHVKV